MPNQIAAINIKIQIIANYIILMKKYTYLKSRFGHLVFCMALFMTANAQAQTSEMTTSYTLGTSVEHPSFQLNPEQEHLKALYESFFKVKLTEEDFMSKLSTSKDNLTAWIQISQSLSPAQRQDLPYLNTIIAGMQLKHSN